MTKESDRDFTVIHAAALAEIAQLAGVEVGDVFTYRAHPTAETARYVFQSWVGNVPGANEVCLSAREADTNIATVLAWCRAHPDKAMELTEHYRA